MLMKKATISLLIPEEIKIRNEIREKVDDFFITHPFWPPVTWDQLTVFAEQLIGENEWDESNLGFVMLCCGNAIWRKIMETIPYQRRILLLPQCLKNSQLCQADMDNIGLLCNNCGNCSISEILHKAEDLGYVTVVSEGTAITTRLIESGKVDAVIGVSCMDVLQKMFRSVNKFAVPGIGIPLLNSGCKDTKADPDWIMQEICRFHEGPSVRLLNLNHLRKRIGSVFVKDKLRQMLVSGKDDTMRIAIGSLMAGGHRIRPFIAILTYHAFCKQPDDLLLDRLALSVECFHKASLIHDDIEDDDPLRYGKQTIHARYGAAVAINAGDLMIGEGYRLIIESGLPADMIKTCIKEITSGHRAMTLGQGAELLAAKEKRVLSLQEMLKIFENKSASAFRVSFLLGGIMGGADSKTLELLSKFSYFTGIAYQIMDDLKDYSGENGDIRFRKPSVLMAMMMSKLSQNEKSVMKQAFIEGNINLIYLYLENYKARDHCVELLKDYINRAKESLDNLANLGLKLALHEILGKIFDKYI
jgi:geranylgeranyl pyrophosphate synthase